MPEMWPRYRCHHLCVKFLPLLLLTLLPSSNDFLSFSTYENLLGSLLRPDVYRAHLFLVNVLRMATVHKNVVLIRSEALRMMLDLGLVLRIRTGPPKFTCTLAPVKSTTLILKLLLRGSVYAKLTKNTFLSSLCHQHITVLGIIVVFCP